MVSTTCSRRVTIQAFVLLVLLGTIGIILNLDVKLFGGLEGFQQPKKIPNYRNSIQGHARPPIKRDPPTTTSRNVPVTEASKELPRKRRIVIIGSGPTALGAARRLYDLKQEDNDTVITILEELGKPGGLASSTRDDKGFLWDVGVHVVFSHYTYFDRVLNMAVSEWNYRRRASLAFMKGSDGVRRFIPYPVQNNIHFMDKIDQQRSLAGLEEITNHPIPGKARNFDEWLLQKFGKGLADVFMRKYNEKIWTVRTAEMNSAWVGERVAVPDISEIKTKIKETDTGAVPKDSEWGPNRFFRYPKYNGTGGVWESVARQLPSHWFKFHHKVTGIDIDKKIISVEVGQGVKSQQDLEYDSIISTAPLDVFTAFLSSSDMALSNVKELASQLVYTHTHIVGVGLRGQMPKNLADKSWVYFPDDDSPFYRVTMFSNYSDDHVPKPAGSYWSLMCEIAEPKKSARPGDWNRDDLVRRSIEALALYGFITPDIVVSKHYRLLHHGYPVPSVTRDQILNVIQPWLKSKGIHSRGRFGGWRYEVANQDHSFMQGVEAVDNLVGGVQEVTYPDPNRANSRKNTDRVIPLDYEIIIAHHDENLDWLKPYANHTLIYHLGNDLGPAFQFYAWERLKDVGREPYAYLYHITTYYNQLANVTVFAQGDKLGGHCFKEPSQFISSAQAGVPCATIKERYSEPGHIKFDKSVTHNKNDTLHISNVTFGQMYQDLYGKPLPKEGIAVCGNGCFGATRAMIRKHPVEFYQKALAYVSKFSNQEESYYLERLWYHFFT